MRYVWRRLVVRDPHLTDATRRVLLELESYAGADGRDAHPGVQRLAEQLRTSDGKTGHVSDRTVRTALATGVERGLIELTRKAPRGRGVRLADVYRLTIPEEIAATWAASNPEAQIGEKPATTTAGETQENTGNRDHKYRQSGPEIPATAIAEHQSLNTRPTTPVKSGGETFANADREGPRSKPVPADGWKLVRSTIPDSHPQSVRTDLAIRAGALTKSGTPPETVEAALRLWLTKPNLGPGTLASLVSEVIKTATPQHFVSNGQPQIGPASQKALGWLEIGNRVTNRQGPTTLKELT